MFDKAAPSDYCPQQTNSTLFDDFVSSVKTGLSIATDIAVPGLAAARTLGSMLPDIIFTGKEEADCGCDQTRATAGAGGESEKEAMMRAAKEALLDSIKHGCFGDIQFDPNGDKTASPSATIRDGRKPDPLEGLLPMAEKLALNNMDKLAQLVAYLPDSTYRPDQLVKLMPEALKDTALGQQLQNVDSITKSNNHISIQLHHPMTIEQNKDVLGGLAKVDGVEVKELTFDITQNANGVNIDHIKGVQARIDTPVGHIGAPVDRVEMHRDSEGNLRYDAVAKNPVPIGPSEVKVRVH